MTREDAIRIIKIVLAIAEDFEITVQGEEFTEEKCKEAVEMATKALEQEPCEDAISRQAVLDLLENTNNGWIINEVLQLPSDKLQEPKTEQLDVFNKIKAEILLRDKTVKDVRTDGHCFFTAEEIFGIIDKHIAERSEE